MKLTRQEFLEEPVKSISLIGMSGVGKSHITTKLKEWGWFTYQCDPLIGTKYLSKQVQGVITGEDILNLSKFVGKIGDPSKDGVDLEEFRKRQQMYYDAEVAVLKDLPEDFDHAKRNMYAKLVNDSSGSLCEVEDESILDAVGKETLFVYLKIDSNDHAGLLERAITYPKPLYFPPKFFDKHLAIYRKKYKAANIEDIDPTAFLRWVFPLLFASRLPKYQALADKYGVTISAGKFAHLSSEEEFIDIIAEALDGQ